MQSTIEGNRFDRFASAKAAIALLTFTKEAAGAIPLIGNVVQGGLGALIEVLTMIDKVKGNREQLEKLFDRINGIFKILDPIISSGAAQSLRRGPLLFRLERLSADLLACSPLLQRLRSYGSIRRRFFEREAIADDIEKINGVIEGAIETFHLEGAIRREAVLDDVAIKVDEISAKLDASAPKGASVVRAAFTNSSAAVCLDGTRANLLQLLHDWALKKSHAERQVAWLHGPPGCGKSTVARTVATQMHNEELLAASFFFSRDHVDRRNAYSVFPSIARQLAEFSPEFNSIAMEIKRKYSGGDVLDLEAQLERFIAEPLRQMSVFNMPWIVVIDALDECDDQEAASEILSLLGLYCHQLPNVRVLITSRPAHDIKSQFAKPSLEPHVHAISLYEIDRTTGSHDIQHYLESELTGTWALREGWSPGEEGIQSLAEISDGLFIYASTCVKLLKAATNKTNMLRELTETRQDGDVSPLQRLNLLYVQILEGMSKTSSDELIEDLGRVLGAIVHLRDPLTAQGLASLLYIDKTSILSTLRPLQSVILVPDSDADSIRFYHQSFRDFLLSQPKPVSAMLPSSQWNAIHIKLSFHDQSTYNSYLAEDCFKTFNVALHRNMSDVDDLSQLNADIPDLDHRLAQNIPSHVRYACLRWASHVSTSHSIRSTSVCNRLEDWARTKMMFWLESLSLCGELERAVASLNEVEKWYQQCPTPADDVLQLLRDGQKFVQTFFEAIESGAGHIYHSALPFTPDSTLLSQYGGQATGPVRILRGKSTGWHPLLWSGERHTDMVDTVAFSPDGRQIVSGSWDETVRVWSSETGKLLFTLEGHEKPIPSVAFSPDGKLIASGSFDKTVRLWSSETGKQLSTLVGHTKEVYAVTFSPNGRQIVSGSRDKTMRTWSSETGKLLSTLEKHPEPIHSLAFSPDGKRIVSGSGDETVRVWSSEKGELLSKFEGHVGAIFSVAFSPNGKRIVSGSWDKTVRVWSSETGKLLFTLAGHTALVYSVTFSPDGQRILSGSWDKTLRTWSSETGKLLSKLEGHADSVTSVAYSPDGKKIVSGSRDKTVRMWSSEREKPLSELERHVGPVYSVAFSPDGRQIVSGSSDKTVRVWSSETGKLLTTLEGHTHAVYSVGFSPDGRRILSIGKYAQSLQWPSGAMEEANDLMGVGTMSFHYDDNGWVTAGGRVICWIPSRNRPTNEGALASYGHVLCTGGPLGDVTILNFSSMFATAV